MDGAKGAIVIRSCRRCHEFYEPAEYSEGCPACAAVGLVSHFTDTHVLCDVSDDRVGANADPLEHMLVNILAAGEPREV